MKESGTRIVPKLELIGIDQKSAMMMMFRPTSRCIHKGITIQRRSISFSNLTIEQSNKTTLPKPAPQDLIFGRTFTDHMLICEYDKDRWKDPKIVPYQNLSLSPAASGLHYGELNLLGKKGNNFSITIVSQASSVLKE